MKSKERSSAGVSVPSGSGGLNTQVHFEAVFVFAAPADEDSLLKNSFGSDKREIFHQCMQQ